MLPIASEIATRVTREHAQSALPHAPVIPDAPAPRSRPDRSRSLRMLAGVLRRVAATSHGLADRLERPVAAK
ncbi:MAG TPA: hypothetical protein VNP20_13935 [Nocardioidaceae bacterium]|nr:hypothetical protein [Nocardioidaceae bacterium]